MRPSACQPDARPWYGACPHATYEEATRDLTRPHRIRGGVRHVDQQRVAVGEGLIEPLRGRVRVAREHLGGPFVVRRERRERR